MNIFALSGLVNGIFALSFGFLLIYKSFRDRINQLFFLMTAAIAVWSFGYWQWLSSASVEPALFWIRFFSIGSIFIPVFYFHWVLELLGQSKNKRSFLYLIYIISILLTLFSTSNLFIKSIGPKLFFPFWPSPGPLYTFYLIFFYFVLVLYAFILLAKSYKLSDKSKKGQISYVVLGAIFGFGGGATNFFLWYGVPIPPFGNFLVSFFPFFLGYAVIKHRLFNVRVIATELLVFSICVFLLVRTVIARTLQDAFLDGGLLVLVILFGLLLIRSVLQEVRSREQIQKLAEDLEKANVELKKLDQLKSEFLSLATHQLRTPLSIIKGYISMIQEGSFGEISSKVRETLSKVYLSNERLINLVNDFLNLSRIESGRMNYNFESTQIAPMIANVVDEFQGPARDKQIELIFEKPDSTLPDVSVDKEKFRQVITNIIDNDLKYTPRGFVKIKIETKSSGGGEVLLITFLDSGVGMVKEDLERIFSRFTRGNTGAKANAEGIGLGLYLAKRIVSDHGGEIWAESPGVGRGSTFLIRLPLRRNLPNPAPYGA